MKTILSPRYVNSKRSIHRSRKRIYIFLNWLHNYSLSCYPFSGKSYSLTQINFLIVLNRLSHENNL